LLLASAISVLLIRGDGEMVPFEFFSCSGRARLFRDLLIAS
jgi:hypothetical protein